MADYFLENHLTDTALDALIAGSADEPARLEIAAHLSSCDRCLLRYTERLSDEICLPPPEPVAPAVQKTLRRRMTHSLAHRYAAAAAAVILAMALWSCGVFSNLVPQNPQRGSWTEHAHSAMANFSSSIGNFFSNLSDSFELLTTRRQPDAADRQADGTPDSAVNQNKE